MQELKQAFELLVPYPERITYLAGSEKEWSDFYSHEPLSQNVPAIKRAIEAIRPFISEYTPHWEVRLFCPDGSFSCSRDGWVLDEEGEPIEGRCAFTEFDNYQATEKP